MVQLWLLLLLSLPPLLLTQMRIPLPTQPSKHVILCLTKTRKGFILQDGMSREGATQQKDDPPLRSF
ncbi:hypothetical protein XELAEV_18042444mg [Xenopus laevis]|uniref:Secreted protein n=1 Tax=Xenopus laevis TaxID=8355 RepID=A0A974C4Q9_XENLA|nr:hypothetical protein XELAEV_18042444mg [Xenopus laevis]